MTEKSLDRFNVEHIVVFLLYVESDNLNDRFLSPRYSIDMSLYVTD